MRGLEELGRLSKDERFTTMVVGDQIAIEATFEEAGKIAGMLDRRFNRAHEAVNADGRVYVRRRR